jgi:O-succinylbenzoic acid--CoA ligase
MEPDIDDALSISAAAADSGTRCALVADGREFTFADLAALAAQRVRECAHEWAAMPADQAVPVVGSNTVETLATLLALLQRQRPALLLDPRHTPAEHEAERAAARAAGPCPRGTAAVIYTSGTTGRARGALLPRTALLASARASAANLGWQDDDRWLLTMPVARIGGLSIVTRCLAARRSVVLAGRFDPQHLPGELWAQRITLVSLVPTMLTQVLDAHPGWTPGPGLRAILLGGAAASPRLLARAAERRLPIVITYGCTETCSQVVSTPYAARFEAAAHGAGRPLPSADIRIEEGRIEVRGPMRMSGYLGEPALDAQAWFDTGDLGEIDARGCLHVHARRADLIVSGGRNVYPAEVERVLEGCAGIAAAAVFGIDDETWGQTVAAALVTDGAAPHAADEAGIARRLAAELAAYKHPRRICFVDALPQTGAGKLDRHALAALAPQLRALRQAPVRGP